MNRAITFDDVRALLGARTMISSSFGAQLERARDGTSGGGGDPRKQQARAEMQLLWDARVIRCVDQLRGVKSIRWAWAPKLRVFAGKIGMDEGELVVRVLEAYEPWNPKWPTRGLVEVYGAMRKLGPWLQPMELEGGEEAAQALREGKARRVRNIAQSLTADAHVALGEWVRIWTSRHDRLAA